MSRKQKKDFLATIVMLLILAMLFHTSGTQSQSAEYLASDRQIQDIGHLTTVFEPTPNYVKLVDPLTGTGVQKGAPFGGGDTFPGATAPFGMVQWSPDTVKNPPGGYAFSDNHIKGFSLTHLSGAGCRVYQDLPFMPYVGTVNTSPALNPSQYVATFSHTNETAYPGYYKVALDNGITTELTTTQRTGAAHFTYPAGKPATLLLNISGSVNRVTRAQGVINGNTISGYVSSGTFCRQIAHYTVYFFVTFSRPFASYGTWHNNTISAGSTMVNGNSSGMYATFNTDTTNVIVARVGLSFVSQANAQANLQAEDPSGDFNTVHMQATQSWNNALSAIRVNGGTPGQRATFYTALYHTLLHPNVFSDANGQYLGFDSKIHTVRPGHAQYANFSGWDIYRSEAQLLAFLAPDKASDMAQSMVNDYVQGGVLPKWSLANWETYDMVGDPADAILADFYAFGATNFDTTTALSAMVQQATRPNNVRQGLHSLLQYGYLPLDAPPLFYGLRYYGSAACSLEYNTEDFAISAFAQALGDTANYQHFLQRSQDWSNLLNVKDRYLEPRYLNGSFQPSYNPNVIRGWVEGDGSQYTWMVPFNLKGLFKGLGGNRLVISRLNTFFTQLNGRPNSPYALMGNEPSLEVPWEYDYAGAPYLTQKVVRQVENALYTTGPGGLPGNDDLGELSSWYVWAALGMFPETPGTANLVLASPLFPSITIKRQSGQTITINAPGASSSTLYVQSLQVNGVSSNKPWLPPTFLTKNGALNYTLSTAANPNWGAAESNAPPSYGDSTPLQVIPTKDNTKRNTPAF
jgi:predicted alpha-1,2-mannosidase